MNAMRDIPLIIALICSLNISSKDTVERWSRYEISLKADVCGNPFDVELKATFTGPDTTMTVRGFYDGGGVFKVRFMPSVMGAWTYCTTSQESQLDNISGEFECVSPTAGNHGPVSVDADNNFKYADGTIYHPIGTTSYDWMHVSGDTPDKTVQSLEKAGFNKIRMLFFVHNFEPSYPEPELFPFEMKSVSTDEEGKLVYEWDFTRFNPDYFNNVEECIEKLAAIGVEADLILFHPYDEGRWNFDRMPMDVNLKYIRYLTSRISSFRNVWWSLANEYDFLRHWKPEEWDTLAYEVVSNDPYSHPCSIHSNTAKYYKYWLPEFTHASIQDQTPVECFGHAATVKNIYKKPVIFDEVCYEGNMENRWGSLSGQEMLYRMWMGTVAGTYVGHGECFMGDSIDYSHDFLAVGGEFQGEAWKRIRFMRNILEAMPNPLMLCDSSWDHKTSTAGDNYYLIYLGKEISPEWVFDLPVRNGKYSRLEDGTRLKVEIIDTWNMTITECPIIFETTKAVKDRVYDINHRHVKLPGLPYLMLRITKAD